MRARADCASRDERDGEQKTQTQIQKSLINWNVTVERNVDLIGLMVGHKEWRVVLSGVQTERDSLPLMVLLLAQLYSQQSTISSDQR